MSKLRVHELARELGRQNREVIEFLKSKGVDVRSHMSMVDEPAVSEVKNRFRKDNNNRGKVLQCYRPSASCQVGSGVKPLAVSLLLSRRLLNGLAALEAPYSAVVTELTVMFSGRYSGCPMAAACRKISFVKSYQLIYPPSLVA